MDLTTKIQIVAVDSSTAVYQQAALAPQAYAESVIRNTEAIAINSNRLMEVIELEKQAVKRAEEEKARAAEMGAARIEAAEERERRKFVQIAVLAAEGQGAMAGLMGGFGELAGIGIVAGVMEHMTEKIADQAIEMDHLSKASGIAVVDIAELEAEMKRIGVSSEILNTMVMRVGVSIAKAKDPTSEQSKAFAALGVDTNALKAGTLGFMDVLQQLAVHLTNSTKAEQDFMNMRQLGIRNSVPMIAFLKEEGDRLKENMASHFSYARTVADSVQSAREMKAAEAALGEEWNILGAHLLPLVAVGIKLVGSALVGLKEFFQVAAIESRTAWEVIAQGAITVKKILVDLAHGGFGEAKKAAADYFEFVRRKNSEMITNLAEVSYQNLQDLRMIWAKGREEEPTGSTNTDIPAKNNDAQSAAEAAIEGQEKHELAKLDMIKRSIEQQRSLNMIGAEQEAADLETINKDELKAKQMAIASRTVLIAADDPEVGSKKQKLLNDATAADDAYRARAMEIQAKLTKEKADAQDRRIEEAIKASEREAKILHDLAEKAAEEKRRLEAEQMRADKIKTEAEVAVQKVAFEQQRNHLESLSRLGMITDQQKLEMLKKIEQAEFKVAEQAALHEVEEADAAGDIVKQAEAEAKLQKVRAEHDKAESGLNDQGAEGKWAPIQKSLDKFNGAFNSFLNKGLQDTRKFGEAFREMVSSMERDWIMGIVNMGLKWAENQIKMLVMKQITNEAMVISDGAAAAQSTAISQTKTLKEIAHSAASAAAAAFKSIIHHVPPPFNFILAPIAAAGTFAAIMAFAGGVSAERGADLPDRPTMAFLHPREMVLPRGEADVVRSMARGGSSSSSSSNATNHNYYAAPGESPDSVSRNMKAFRRALRDGAAA